MDLLEKLERITNDLDVAVKKLRDNGTAYAEAEKNYKMQLSQTALELIEGGMAVTLIDKVIYGILKVANLRFKRDVAKVVYEANKESINVSKLKLRIVEAQINREWGQAK